MSNEFQHVNINENSSNLNFIQGVANEVLLAVVATSLIIFYFIISVIRFFKDMPLRNFDILEILRNIWNNLRNNNNENPNVDPGNQNQQPNIQQEFISENNCSICLNQIQYEITTSCFHLFCAKCIIDYWNSRHKYQIDCPMCRTKITMFHLNFDESQVQNLQIKPVINEVYHYNFQYSNERKSIWVKIRELPFYIRRIISFLSTREGLRFLVFSVSHSVFLICLIFYILSPLDLIPEAIFGLIGFIDDLIALAVLIYFLTDLYYQYMMRRNRIRYHAN